MTAVSVHTARCPRETARGARIGRRGAWGGVRLLRRWWMRVVGGRRQRLVNAVDRMHADHLPGGSPHPAGAAIELAERRSEAMRRLFPKLSAWRAPPSFFDQVTAAYDDLSQATDLDDLDLRVRRIEQDLFPAWAARSRAMSYS